MTFPFFLETTSINCDTTPDIITLSSFLDEYAGKNHYSILELSVLLPNAHRTLMLHIVSVFYNESMLLIDFQ